MIFIAAVVAFSGEDNQCPVAAAFCEDGVGGGAGSNRADQRCDRLQVVLKPAGNLVVGDEPGVGRLGRGRRIHHFHITIMRAIPFSLFPSPRLD